MAIQTQDIKLKTNKKAKRTWTQSMFYLRFPLKFINLDIFLTRKTNIIIVMIGVMVGQKLIVI